MGLENLSYPIGRFQPPAELTQNHLNAWIGSIKTFPERLEKAIAWLTTTQLDTPYRPGGWTVRQLVHHLADSHTNAYVRLKLGLTENEPTIKTYDQDAWAALPDAQLPVEISVRLLLPLHRRWVEILETMTDWERKIYHPGQAKWMSLAELTGHYAWHGEHHLAHVTGLIERKGW